MRGFIEVSVRFPPSQNRPKMTFDPNKRYSPGRRYLLHAEANQTWRQNVCRMPRNRARLPCSGAAGARRTRTRTVAAAGSIVGAACCRTRQGPIGVRFITPRSPFELNRRAQKKQRFNCHTGTELNPLGDSENRPAQQPAQAGTDRHGALSYAPVRSR